MLTSQSPVKCGVSVNSYNNSKEYYAKTIKSIKITPKTGIQRGIINHALSYKPSWQDKKYFIKTKTILTYSIILTCVHNIEIFKSVRSSLNKKKLSWFEKVTIISKPENCITFIKNALIQIYFRNETWAIPHVS